MNKKLLSKEERAVLGYLLNKYWENKQSLFESINDFKNEYLKKRYIKTKYFDTCLDMLNNSSDEYYASKDAIDSFYRDLKKRNPFIGKIFNQRNFPASLKNYILHKDNFTCQVCNAHKGNLPEKVHLEIDHIIAWQDGGKTTYSNGQTICSDCNKGKHHAKKYLKLAV